MRKFKSANYFDTETSVTTWPRREKTNNLTLLHANHKGADQPAHPHSLVSAFVVRCVESLLIKLAACTISIFLLVAVAERVGLSFKWSQTPHQDPYGTAAFNVAQSGPTTRRHIPWCLHPGTASSKMYALKKLITIAKYISFSGKRCLTIFI